MIEESKSVKMSVTGIAVAAAVATATMIGTHGRNLVTFQDSCHCKGNHGVARWMVKTDPEYPPITDDSHPLGDGIQPISPSDACDWTSPTGVTQKSPRAGRELQWYALTGRINKIKVEADGDIHIQLQGEMDQCNVVVEIPVGDEWCELRKAVLSWTDAKFPFTIESDKNLTINDKAPKMVTVIGKAFYDIDHAGKQGNNRRLGEPTVSVWEIHPVMAIDVQK